VNANEDTAPDIAFPAIICKRSSLVVIRKVFFHGISTYSQEDRILEIAVANNVEGSLKWILDRSARLHILGMAGMAPATMLQRIGLVPRRERYQVSLPTEVSPQELLSIIANLEDDQPEVPNVSDLRRLLQALPQQRKIQASDLHSYFGE
jgi:hypothetical protein